MKPVLFILNTPPPYQGTTIMNKQLMDCFSREGIPYLHLQVEGAGDLHSLGKFSLNKIKSALRVMRGIIRERKKYDTAYLVMSVEGFAFYRHALFIYLLRLLGKKYILHLRGLGFRNKKGFGKRITASLFRKGQLVQHSPYNSFDISAFPVSKVSYIPNGWVDHYPAYREEVEARLGRTSDKTQVVFLSNLIADKGLFTVLEAASILQHFGPTGQKIVWNFVGKWENAETQQRFETFVAENGLGSSIGHVGPLFNEEKYRFLAQMDLLVFPTFYKHETWGNVILEAMMFKIPVIATNYVAIPEMVIPGVTGQLIEREDSRTLSEHIRTLHENPTQRKKMGETARAHYLKNFTIDRFEKSMIELISSVNRNQTK